MKSGNSILSSYGTTVFEVMSRLAAEHEAINLGQGFPDDGGPRDVVEAAATALREGWNQYPPMMGLPVLRQAVADHNRRFYGLDYDWRDEVLVTSGATEALAAGIFGLIEPGDEVVLFEPFYDSYLPIVRRAGGVPRIVTLAPPDWSFRPEDLEAVFSARTKLVVLNNPLNPAAKVFRPNELAVLADFVRRHDAFVLCDEVYEHLVFDRARHLPLASLPGLRGRCLRIGSAGKTFSLTGWKVGYVSASRELLKPVAKAHQFLTFTTPPNLQSAVAHGLGKNDEYFTGLAADMQAKRDRLGRGLLRLGFEVLPSAGTYFLVADIRPHGGSMDDADFCRFLTTEAGVAAIPLSAFYVRSPVHHLIRFCFAKRNDVLDAALERLAGVF